MRAVFSKTGTALKTACLIAGLVALPGTAPANEAAIEVVMNQAKIVKLAREADTIVIGNPEIADAAVQDATTIVLTGKGFGVTNLVVLDLDGQRLSMNRLSSAGSLPARSASIAGPMCRRFPARPTAKAPTRRTRNGPPKPRSAPTSKRYRAAGSTSAGRSTVQGLQNANQNAAI